MRKAARVPVPLRDGFDSADPESAPRGTGRQPGRPRAGLVPARQHALALLARKDWTRKAMLERLATDGYDEADASDAVGYLVETGYLDDRAYAARFVEAARSRVGHGPARLERELLARGVPAEVVAEALGPEREPADEAAAATEVARAMLRVTPTLPARKLASRLASRGFSWDAVRTALTRSGKNPEDDPEP